MPTFMKAIEQLEKERQRERKLERERESKIVKFI